MLPTVTTPDWLARHDGELRLSKLNDSSGIYIGGQLRYVLMPLPAKGKYTCRISDTVNGQRLDRGATYDSAEEAARGGLEELRAALGW